MNGIPAAQIFNILCEQPETVAAFLVPRARTVAARGEAGRYIRFLTLPRALLRFITAPLRTNRFFNADGAPLSAILIVNSSHSESFYICMLPSTAIKPQVACCFSWSGVKPDYW